MYTFREIREAFTAEETGRQAPLFPFGVDLQEVLQKIREQPAYSSLREEIREEAQRAEQEPLLPLTFTQFHQFEKQGTRFEYERPYFDRRRRLLGLVYATLIDGTEQYLPVLEDLIWEICNEYTWCVPAHLPFGLEAARSNVRLSEEQIDLFASETGHGLAETLYLLSDKLNPWIAERIRTEVNKRILQPMYREPSRFGWESVTNNWSAVCGGAVGMTALLLEENPERLAGLIDRLLQAMECYMEGFENDGGCPEGIGYWLYGFGYYMYFAEMLESYTAGKLRLLDTDKCRRIAEFPLSISLSDGSFVNYSDASGRSSLHTGMVAQLVRRYGLQIPYLGKLVSLHQDHCYRFAHVSRNLLWSDQEMLGRSTPAGEWELADLQWIVSRQKAGNAMVAFSAKGGHNAEPHNHNDVGHFILHAGGESLLADLGAGVYTRDYFGEKRYTYLHNSSKGHSVPVIDGQEQQDGHACAAVVTEKVIEPGHIRLGLDLTAAYPGTKLEQFHRQFQWIFTEGVGRLSLTDRFAFTQAPHSLEEVFISLNEPVLEPGLVRWQGEKAEATLRYDDRPYSAAVEVIPTQAHLGQPITVYRLTLAAKELSARVEFAGEFEVKPVQ
ncbi:MAG: hypothetical protein K0R57_2505 [Paenibacillaceae bacterium]|nr:hypothetical protein [Paenibacillaceae bacterium]